MPTPSFQIPTTSYQIPTPSFRIPTIIPVTYFRTSDIPIPDNIAHDSPRLWYTQA
ncbi:hypothetical protein L873DRAFT_1811199 [Choiromyces venosus 120613-1]|uniref:Uncharacterized protein n=1 Tax=Choiromyces venosus 120613-1 TaxID=1336337 RepID=A0A3N4JIN3_9PEZI|nr:hypothetical protein L873DRAFT_1811199 [Choiromyces venosus 120613-1]